MKSTPPKGNTYYKGRAKNYEKRRLKQPWWHTEQQEMQSLLSNLPRDLTVLDVPFGTGRFVPYYVDFGYNISGLDASNEMIAAAQESLGALFQKCDCRTGDAANLPYPDGAFELVVSTRFLRDIVVFGMAKKMLAEMIRVSSRYAIIQLGNAIEGDRLPNDDEVWGGNMSKDSIDRLLAEYGVKVLGSGPIEFIS
jgi:ubiquinone/menaquinone biosynthesis C-methylase UbiE